MEDPSITLSRWLWRRTSRSLALLMLVLAVVVFQLVGFVRGLDTELLLTVAMLGLLIGWGCARSRLSGRLAFIAMCALGLVIVFVRVGRLDGQLLNLLRVLADFASQFAYEPLRSVPDVAPIGKVLFDLWSAISAMSLRVRDWLWALAARQSAYDPVAIAVVWSLLLWGLATWAAWFIRRRLQPLPALLPTMALLASIGLYVGEYPAALLLLLAVTLLLMAFVGYDARERQWRAAGVDYYDGIRFDLAMVVVPLTVGLLLVAVVLPSLSVQEAVKLARQTFAGSASAIAPVTEALGIEAHAAPLPSLFEALRAPGLPRQHLLGTGPELSLHVVMTVKTDDPPSDGLPPPYYWRSVTYERYTGRGWISDLSELVPYPAGAALNVSPPPGARKVQQTVQWAEETNDGLLYATGVLISADHDYEVVWRDPHDAFGARIDALAYRAESWAPVFDEAQLRARSSDYPEWIRNRYLALPADVPARVLALARDLTATAPTPYDRARAIERYLRSFPYTLALPQPPASRDIVDYFLFDLKQGYCDYDATAMVVLARAAGLPARLVVGYASGKYDALNQRYIVTAADAHSWVEIYFVDYGWVEFEPTGGRSPFARVDDTIALPDINTAPRVTSNPWGEIGRWGWFALWGGLCTLALSGMSITVVDRWRLRRLSPACAVTTIYQRLYQHGQRLRVPVRSGDTPYEFSVSFTRHLTELAQRNQMFAPALPDIRWLTDVYVRACFSRHPPGALEGQQALKTWARLERRLWLAWLLHLCHLCFGRMKFAATHDKIGLRRFRQSA